jgi:hypothetical protein
MQNRGASWLRAAIIVVVASVVLTPTASAQPMRPPVNWPTHDEQEALGYLLHAEAWADRGRAAEELRDQPGGTPLRVVPGLLAALAREAYPAPFAEMLITLGSSGAREAWPILRAHLDAEDDDVRDAAEEGLERWHLRNNLSPATPAPPYPPAPPPYSPASQGLEQWLGYPPPPMDRMPAPTLERRSQAMRVVGIVSASVGLAAIMLGPLMFIGDSSSGKVAGYTMITGGGLAFVGGGVMTYLGGEWVPIERQSAGVRARYIRPATGGLAWVF